MEKDKLDRLEKKVKELEKKYGDGTAALNTTGIIKKIPRWSVSSPKLSSLFGGGIPKGRIIEVYGPESSGKTTLSCYLAGQVQAQGGGAAFIDAEQSLDAEFVHKVGFRTDEAIIVQPNSGEDGLNAALDLAESPDVDIIIIDSVSALVPRAEIEGNVGDQQMGLQARMMGQALRKLAPVLQKTQTTLIFINQIRHKIGVIYGSPEVTSGGNALKFYASMRLDVRRRENIQDKEELIGIRMRVKTAKSKVSRPMATTEIDLYFETGFDVDAEFVDFAISFGLIEKAASWFTIGDQRVQGKAALIDYLRENEELYEEVKRKVSQVLVNGVLEEDFEEIEEEEIKEEEIKEE